MKRIGRLMGLVLSVGVMVVYSAVGTLAWADDLKDSEVGARAVPQMSVAQPGQLNTQIPAFPQKFDVQGPEVDAFGFAVTQPGPLTVDVQGQGAPVLVTLRSPGGQAITQQAIGNLHINYNVTPQDIQRNVSWQLQIRLTQPVPPQMGGQATGMVNVLYPPVNQAMVQQAAQAAAGQRHRQSDQERDQALGKLKAQLDSVLMARKTQYEQQLAQRRAGMNAQLQAQAGGFVRPRGVNEPQVESNAGEQPSLSATEQIGTRGTTPQFQGITTPGAMVPLGTAPTSVAPKQGSLIPLASAPAPTPFIDHLNKSQGQPKDQVTIYGKNFGNAGGDVVFHIGPTLSLPGVVESWSDTVVVVDVPDAPGLVQFDGGVFIPMGQIQSNTVPFRFLPSPQPPMITPPPSVWQWQPGDPVMITGSGFGNGGGEVHFVVGPNGQELVATYGITSGVYWGNNQIVANVPDASGLTAYNGFVYVVRYPDKVKSQLVPFQFTPLLEYRSILRFADASFQQNNDLSIIFRDWQGLNVVTRSLNNNCFFGAKGNDKIYLTTHLRTGWSVVQPPTVTLPFVDDSDGGAYLSDSHVGTDSPYTNVRWWFNGSFSIPNYMTYTISILIQGPKGTPDGVVVQ